MIGALFLLMAGAAGSDCRPESFVSLPLTPSNPWAPPWSCAGAARACWPCRFEFTQEGESAPSQVEAWTFDRDGKLLRFESRIADQVTVVTCEPAAGPGRTVCRRVVPIPPRAQTPSDAVKGGRGGKQKAGPAQVELVEHLELKRGRLTTSSLELQPGVVGTHGTGRYLYDCKADPASIP